MIERALCEAAFHEAIIACDPALRVSEALAREPSAGRRGDTVPGAATAASRGELIGLAIGKAAVAMARGAGPVARGLVVAPRGRVATSAPDAPPPGDEIADVPLDHGLPAGWSIVHAAHPLPDDTSFAAGAEAIRIVDSAGPDDIVLALVSGGASALVEQPREGLGVDDYRERVRTVMASGAPIAELNRVRTELSAIKGGKLAARSKAPVITLVVSDVIGDDPRVIGSGPTVTEPPRNGDRALVVAPMASFGIAVADALAARGIAVRRIAEPIADDVAAVADRLAAEPGDGPERGAAQHGVVVAWGEPTLRVPEAHGTGGRAQQLALELARHLRGTSRSAFVAGSDGRDGPTDAAGAYVDGTTWDALVARAQRDPRLDPDAALRRCDAGTALAAVGALVITGPTGINHADVVILG